jgi:hypothetical protein
VLRFALSSDLGHNSIERLLVDHVHGIAKVFETSGELSMALTNVRLSVLTHFLGVDVFELTVFRQPSEAHCKLDG